LEKNKFLAEQSAYVHIETMKTASQTAMSHSHYHITWCNLVRKRREKGGNFFDLPKGLKAKITYISFPQQVRNTNDKSVASLQQVGLSTGKLRGNVSNG